MREIKFRALLNNGKITKAYTLEQLIENGEDYISEEAFECENSLCQYNGFCECDFDVTGYDIKCLLQYTGLKDKNDVEIYEGDIVKYFISNRDSANLGVEPITFKKGCFYIDDRHLLFKTTKIEVIGNIHENPKLLKDK